jgi:cytochrome c biogenesis protein CcmG/thiol:disulfide interchange protein DsbE
MRIVRTRLLVVSILVALLVSVIGGWLLSRSSSDDVDAKLTGDLAGGVQDPTIGTNVPVQGTPLPAVSLAEAASGNVVPIVVSGRPAVVNFWYSTCEPCRREMPVLARSSQDFAGQVDFIGINPLDSAKAALEFAARYNVTYPTYLDPDGVFITAAGIGTMPVTLFVDANGIIVKQFAGEINYATLTSIIESELGVTKGAT